jgi:hypothetical protein
MVSEGFRKRKASRLQALLGHLRSQGTKPVVRTKVPGTDAVKAALVGRQTGDGVMAAKQRDSKNGDSTSDKDRSFTPDRKGEDSAGAIGEDRKRAVDANRTGGGERPETKPKPNVRNDSGYDDPDRI